MRGLVAVLIGGMLFAAPARAGVSPACHGEGTAAVSCLVHASRASSGLGKLRRHPLLDAAARRYAHRMAREGFFAHVAPDGERPHDRMLSVGYGRPGHRWRAGEALGTGTGEWGTPQAVVFQWLASPPHRRVLLSPRAKHLGVGMAELPVEPGRFPARVYVVYTGRR